MGYIKAFLTEEVTIKPFLRQGSGAPVYGKEETRVCRLERGRNLKVVYKNPSGTVEETPAAARMFCEGEPIPPRSQVTHGSNTYTVIDCIVMSGVKTHHLEVYLE